MIVNKFGGNGGGGSYVLPVASQSTLGGVKIGSGISIDSAGTISSNSYVLSAATDSTLGGVKVGSGLAIDSGGTLSVSGGTEGIDFFVVTEGNDADHIALGEYFVGLTQEQAEKITVFVTGIGSKFDNAEYWENSYNVPLHYLKGAIGEGKEYSGFAQRYFGGGALGSIVGVSLTFGSTGVIVQCSKVPLSFSFEIDSSNHTISPIRYQYARGMVSNRTLVRIINGYDMGIVYFKYLGNIYPAKSLLNEAGACLVFDQEINGVRCYGKWAFNDDNSTLVEWSETPVVNYIVTGDTSTIGSPRANFAVDGRAGTYTYPSGATTGDTYVLSLGHRSLNYSNNPVDFYVSTAGTVSVYYNNTLVSACTGDTEVQITEGSKTAKFNVSGITNGSFTIGVDTTFSLRFENIFYVNYFLSPNDGQLVFDTSNNTLKVYYANAWHTVNIT